MNTRCLQIVALVLLLASPAFGDVAFSNFGEKDEFDLSTAYIIGHFPDSGIENQHLGFEFTASVTGTVDSVELAAFEFEPGDKDSLLVTIFSDDEGLPDEPVWSGLGNPGTTPEIIEIESNAVSDVLLIEGQNCWVTARSLNVTGAYAWSFSLDSFGNAVLDPTGGEDFALFSQLEQGAFRVNVDTTSIPEPAALLPLTMLSMFCLRRSR